MKQNLFLITVLICSIAVISNGQQESCCLKNFIKVGGFGVNQIKPDIAKIYAYMETEDKTATQALIKMDAKIDKVIKEVLYYLVNDYDFQTSSIKISPKYDNNDTNTITGYRV